MAGKPQTTHPSYIYPVRSLLSGRIQPAAEQPSPQTDTSRASDSTVDTFLISRESPIVTPTRTPVHGWMKDHAHLGSAELWDEDIPLEDAHNISSPISPGTPTLTSRLRRRTKSDSQSFFNHSVISSTQLYRRRQSTDVLNLQHLLGDKHTSSRITDSPFESSSRSSPQLIPPLDVPSAPSLPLSTEEVIPALDFNPSEYVHLPPLALQSTPESTVQLEDSEVYDYSLTGESQDQEPVTHASSVYSHSNSSQPEHLSIMPKEPFTTFRYEHAQDEHGNHVVIGREGELQRCEDEPIRTPGAIQSFGVLVVVEELENALVVRQVSENSTELLGLSPHFLFSLECFTDTLPDAQVDILWDNIQSLNPPDSDTQEGEEEGPHVFLLTGWGAPGSAPQDANNGRSLWTCWCATHRPTIKNSLSSASTLIIMEFELERDTLNPLYPPIPSEKPVSASEILVLPTNESAHEIAVNIPELVLGQEPQPLTQFQPATGSVGDGLLSNDTPTQGSTHSTEVEIQQLVTPQALVGLEGSENWSPSAQDIIESTTNGSKPLPALERLRRINMAYPTNSVDAPKGSMGINPKRGRHGSRKENASVGMMDVFAAMGQINEQLGEASDLDSFLKVVVGVIQDLTQFHRVLVYQFDESWNGQVVAELVDWNQTKDLYRGLHFPATDIPAQARTLYAINKVRLLYDRSQPTARIVVRNKEDLDIPLDMTHCYLRAMSPIHIKYLANMGVRASMSVSIMAFGALWGLITCHSYGSRGMRVSFPVRQMLRLLSQSISRNTERLIYAQRLHTRKLINTMVSDTNRRPTGYIVSDADDLLKIFDADFGILIIGEGAKILGPNQHGQEILIMAEYLRLKEFDTIHVSQAVTHDFPDLQPTASLEVIAGLLHVPLSSGGKDFIAFLRKSQTQHVRWAGKPYKDGTDVQAILEPRKSFKIWSEAVAGRCRAWTDEQIETAGVLALVYGKFIEVWRQKENALQTTKLSKLLLSNASHEVRTPLNHIINYLEMALNGPLDTETRDNLTRSHAASKSLLFTINDLLDLTRLESGNETSFNEPFNLQLAIKDATHLYRKEAERRKISFILDLQEGPKAVVGDVKKIQTIVQNLTANSLKYTSKGSITVRCATFDEPTGLRDPTRTVVEIIVADTGCGIPPNDLEKIFREFEQVESLEPKASGESGVGLGLAVVARILEQLGGQLRVESAVDEGSRFSFLIPLGLSMEDNLRARSMSPKSESDRSQPSVRSLHLHTGTPSSLSGRNEIEDLVEALASNHITRISANRSPKTKHMTIEDTTSLPNRISAPATLGATGSQVAMRPEKVNNLDQGIETVQQNTIPERSLDPPTADPSTSMARMHPAAKPTKLRILIVEDNNINRAVLAKRLRIDGHTVVNTTNGQECLDKIELDRLFDAVLMDIQMPILNGFEATQGIRKLEKEAIHDTVAPGERRLSHELNGRIPVFAVSASLLEHQRDELRGYGLDGWILKPINFHRLSAILRGVIDPVQRQHDIYRPGNWEAGGWL